MSVIVAAAVASTAASSKRNSTRNDNNDTIHMEYRGNFFLLYIQNKAYLKKIW